MPVARQAKETECQKCRKYYETVPVVKYVKECAPVYDEKCHTDYHQHCKTETRCVMIYQTVCGPAGVGLESGKKPGSVLKGPSHIEHTSYNTRTKVGNVGLR